MSAATFATAAIFIFTYMGVALVRIPGLRLDRAGIALTGAALMMAIGAITPEEAYRATDLDTLALLLGMMIVVAHLSRWAKNRYRALRTWLDRSLPRPVAIDSWRTSVESRARQLPASRARQVHLLPQFFS